MGLSRRRFFELVASAVVPTILGTAWALDYPTRPVRIIVGFPPGGPTDIFARLIAEWLSNRLGQAFIVENRSGAGSTIGVAAVVSAPPDGYTLLLISTSAVNSTKRLMRDLPFPPSMRGSASSVAQLSKGPGEFERLFVGDAEKWTKVMRAANIRPE
jgi:tripartite-type tricarboxylate transporter receptor subunit TctC